jgi:hypothetical protein
MNRHPMTRKQVAAEIRRSLQEQRQKNLRDASLVSVDLTSLNLRGADLSGADLTGANLRNVHAPGATFDRANLSRANCVGANLRKASLVGAQLNETDLSLANLEEACLRDAHLQAVRCRGTCFYGAVLPLEGLGELVGVTSATFRRRAHPRVERTPVHPLPRVRPPLRRQEQRGGEA